MARRFKPGRFIRYTDPGFTAGAGIVYSMAFWMKSYSTAINVGLLALLDTGGNARVTIDINPGAGRLRLVNARSTSGTQTQTANSVINPKVWQHVYVQYNGGFSGANGDFYINGVLVAKSTADGSGAAVTANGDYQLGTSTWDGLMADFAIWNRLLRLSEIKKMASGYSALFINPGRKYAVPFIGDRNIQDFHRSGIVSDGGTFGTGIDKPNIIYPQTGGRIRHYLKPMTGGTPPTPSDTGIMTPRSSWWGDL